MFGQSSNEVALLADNNDVSLVTDPRLYPVFPPQSAIRYASAVFDFGDAKATEALDAMVELAGTQPGFLGIDSARGSDRVGITVSYWANEAAALAWRGHAGHSAIRDQGRADWYESYHLIVAEVAREHLWQRPG